MDVTTSTRSDAVVVAVEGEIDIHSSPEVEKALLDAVDNDDSADVVLDLTRTTFLDSTSLGVMVGVHKQLHAARRAFSVICPDPKLRRLFRITRLDEVWPILTDHGEIPPER